VRPIEVVLHEIALELAAKPHVLRDKIAGERGLPALVEDGALDPLDEAVGLRAPGSDERVGGAQVLDCGVEAGVAELRPIVCRDPLEVPSGIAQVASDLVREQRAEVRIGVSGGDIYVGGMLGLGAVAKGMTW